MRFAFISRHKPTPQQHSLAANHGIELVEVGDADAFAVSSGFIHEKGDFEGAIVVHPAAALRLCSDFVIGVFENEMRPKEGGKPTFSAKQLYVYDLRD